MSQSTPPRPASDPAARRRRRRNRPRKLTQRDWQIWDAATFGASMAVLAVLFPILCFTLVRYQPAPSVPVNPELYQARILSPPGTVPDVESVPAESGADDSHSAASDRTESAVTDSDTSGEAVVELGAVVPTPAPLSTESAADAVLLSPASSDPAENGETEDYALQTSVSKGTGQPSGPLSPRTSSRTVALAEDLEQSTVKSQYAVVLDARSGEILAERNSDVVMNPASMTKVLTILVAAETLKNPKFGASLPEVMNTPVCITQPNRDYCWSNGCSVAGFLLWETVTIRDCFYATILPSGADGAYALAVTCAGSHEGFVELMNRKARELGLSESAHFTNCVGLYDADHHCTVRDIAIIMKAALDNPVCRTVLTTMTWTTSKNDKHPYGIFLRNRFLYRTPTLVPDATVTVLGAKTGYVRQAGCCAVSMARRSDGNEYICVTGMSWSSNQVIRDHGSLYERFCANA